MIGSKQFQSVLAPRRIGALTLVATLGLCVPAHAQSGPYVITKIAYPGATDTTATGISNAGLVAGFYHDASGAVHSFTWDGATYTNVDFPGSVANYGMGISRAGQVLGTYAMAVEGPYHASILDQGTFTSFDYPSMDTDARGTNASGKVVGVYNSGGLSAPHGYIMSGTTFTPLDFPGAPGTEAWGINDAGTVSGLYYDATGIHGFLYSGGIFSALNYPGASSTSMMHINNLNQAVGWYTSGGRPSGFVYSGSSFRSLSVDGATATHALDINDSGTIVGQYSSADCPNGCGFLAVPTAGTPVCDQRVTLSYSSGTLTLGFTLTTAAPTTWATYAYLQNTLVPLWSTPIPALPTPTPLTLRIPGVPNVGKLLVLSTMSAGNNFICADFATVNTGP